MMGSMPFRRAVGTPLLVLFASGCAQILRQPSSAQEGAWSLDVREIRDGPDSYGEGNRGFIPAEDTHFLWVYMTLRNQTAQNRRFVWNQCDLDSQSGAVLPSVIASDATISRLKDSIEIVYANTQLERKIAFSYPEGQWPTRLRCGKLVIPLDLKL